MWFNVDRYQPLTEQHMQEPGDRSLLWEEMGITHF